MRDELRDTISRRLVRYLEENTLRYGEIQDFVYSFNKHKNKSNAPKGYWCSSIKKLIACKAIIKFDTGDYFSVPGTSNDRFIYNYDRFVSVPNRSNYLLHPVIKRYIIQRGEEENYI